MQATTKYIQPLVYKENNNFYGPSGLNKRISCNQIFLGLMGINTIGEEVPVPYTTIPPLSASPGNSYQSANVLIQVGQVWVDKKFFGDSSFKVVAKVKDLDTNSVFYVDADSYNTNLVLCNFVPEPSFCPLVTNISAGTPGATTATITWNGVPGAAGIEWVNNTSSSAPSGDGAYLDGGTETLSLTGLTTATTYHIWIRTICGQGSRSAWTSKTYTTA